LGRSKTRNRKTMTRPNDAAFARASFHHDNFGRPDNAQTGLTKREYFAVMAMQGLITTEVHNDSRINLAKESIKLADALIEELNKKEEK
jgi:hypothetical protein